MARGNARALIFLDSRDYERFLEVFDEVVVRFRLVCWAMCLMPNHYHLVIRTPEANLSAAIKHLNGVYSQWWNHRHERCGHTFQGRFKAQLVQRERYLAAVCRYVVLNPVRAGLVSQPEGWEWSSYRASAHMEPAPPFLDSEGIAELLPVAADAEPGEAYRRFIDDGDTDTEIRGLIRGDRRFLGDADFLADRRRTLIRERPRGVSRREQAGAAQSLQRLFEEIRNTRQRNERIRQAADVFGYPRSKIAQHLGLHPVYVTQILRTVRRDRATTEARDGVGAGTSGSGLGHGDRHGGIKIQKVGEDLPVWT